MQIKQALTSFLRSKGFQLLIVSFAIMAVLPFFISDSFFLYILTLIFVFAIYAASWNFLANSGQGSLGHAVFLGIGGFSSAILGGNISRAMVGLLGGSRMPFGVVSIARPTGRRKSSGISRSSTASSSAIRATSASSAI